MTNKRSLGSTGFSVSEIALGTVELGMEYGFRGSAHYQPPEPQEAVRLLRAAFGERHEPRCVQRSTVNLYYREDIDLAR